MRSCARTEYGISKRESSRNLHWENRMRKLNANDQPYSGHKKWEIKFKNRFPKVTILNWKSIAKVKTLNSNSLSSKSISIIGNSKAMIDIRQLRIRGCENVVLNSQFPLWPALSPSPNFFLRSGGPCFFSFAFKKWMLTRSVTRIRCFFFVTFGPC